MARYLAPSFGAIHPERPIVGRAFGDGPVLVKAASVGRNQLSIANIAARISGLRGVQYVETPPFACISRRNLALPVESKAIPQEETLMRTLFLAGVYWRLQVSLSPRRSPLHPRQLKLPLRLRSAA